MMNLVVTSIAYIVYMMPQIVSAVTSYMQLYIMDCHGVWTRVVTLEQWLHADVPQMCHDCGEVNVFHIICHYL